MTRGLRYGGADKTCTGCAQAEQTSLTEKPAAVQARLD